MQENAKKIFFLSKSVGLPYFNGKSTLFLCTSAPKNGGITMVEMEIMRKLFGSQLTEVAKMREEGLPRAAEIDNKLGWVRFSNDYIKGPAVRTYQTLETVAKDYIFFTPNTFYKHNSRRKTALRWLNALSIDIDVKSGENKGLKLDVLFDKIKELGLPMPTIVVETPSGGFHLHWFFSSPRRHTGRLRNHFERVQKEVCEALNGDRLAVGAERFFRTPTKDNVLFTSDSQVNFDFFCDWYAIRREEQVAENKKTSTGTYILQGKDLLNHPAIKKILEGYNGIGKRDNACFTLALVYKKAGYTREETEQKLHKWNQKNKPSLNWTEVRQKVRSAFNGRYFAPSTAHIKYLSGMDFKYVKWVGKKARNKRTYSHLNEWERDVLRYIKRENGSLQGSQRKLAEKITYRGKSISFTTLKRVLKSLEEKGLIVKVVEGQGRKQVTTIKLAEVAKKEKVEETKEDKNIVVFNGPNPKNMLVGGRVALSSQVFALPKTTYTPYTVCSTSSSLRFAPVPANVPDSFSSLLFNHGFRDGRFIFSAWGRIQLAFKDFHVPFSAISSCPEHLSLATEALRYTLDRKGSITRNNFVGADGFLKYLFGTARGLLFSAQQDSLQAFTDYIEDLTDIRLLALGAELESRLELADSLEASTLRTQLQEINSELSARQRRQVAQQSFWCRTSLDDFRLFLKS